MTDEHIDRLVRDADPYRPDVVGRLDGAEQTLLEEIMSVPAEPRPRRVPARRLAGAVAAAAVLIAILAFSAVQHRQAGNRPAAIPTTPSSAGPTTGGSVRYSAVALKAAEENPRLLIDEPGWKATTVYGFTETSGTIAFTEGDRSLEMNWYPGDEYDGYYENRLDVSAPKPATVDGLPGNLFTYSANDFAIMLRPHDGVFVELRTEGDWTRAGFDTVVADIKRVDVRTWLDALPPEIVTPGKVQDAADEVLADVPLPPGFDRAALDGLGTNDPYQFGAEVTSRVGCGWIAEYLRAKGAGDTAAAERAAHALQSSHKWKVLQRMVDQGDWAEAFWEVADEVAAGDVPAGYAQSIGCE
jgi:hypothetical protein